MSDQELPAEIAAAVAVNMGPEELVRIVEEAVRDKTVPAIRRAQLAVDILKHQKAIGKVAQAEVGEAQDFDTICSEIKKLASVSVLARALELRGIVIKLT